MPNFYSVLSQAEKERREELSRDMAELLQMSLEAGREKAEKAEKEGGNGQHQ